MGAASLRDWLYPPPGKAGFESWDAEDLLVLARMWQAGDVGACLTNGPEAEGKEEYKKALEGVECRVLVMLSRTDQYFPPEDSEVGVKHLKRRKLEVIETIWGHIAGGRANPVDVEWMDGRAKEFLSERGGGISYRCGRRGNSAERIRKKNTHVLRRELWV